ncbi:MAG: hypothetical protein E7608_04605 [Ruminococcaceae bacterium]|nr:hypothetical protein [Oscillospiraceae bacterium]
MKKIAATLLCLTLLPCTFLAACGKKSEEGAFGMGVYSYYSSSEDATEEKDGSATVLHTAAAVLIDKNGKILDIDLDAAECIGEYSVHGSFIEKEKFSTKKELGDSYGMAKYGTDRDDNGKVLEWDEQAEAFENIAKGKTLDEIKALVSGSYGTEDVIKAGCTIAVSDFVKAIEKAFANAQAYAEHADEAELGIVSVQSDCKNASEEADGVNNIETYFAAALKDHDGKVVTMMLDSAEAEIKFDMRGKALTDTSAAIPTKNELGTDYGMAKYGTDTNGDGKILEWFEQADVFKSFCKGKTAAQIAGLIYTDGYALPDIQAAGCTIYISDMAKAAVKAAE